MSRIDGTDNLFLGDSYCYAGNEVADKVLGAAGMLPGKNYRCDPSRSHCDTPVLLIDKVNENNIDEVLEEWNDFIGKGDRCSSNELVNCIKEALYEIKDKRLITLHLNRNP